MNDFNYGPVTTLEEKTILPAFQMLYLGVKQAFEKNSVEVPDWFVALLRSVAGSVRVASRPAVLLLCAGAVESVPEDLRHLAGPLEGELPDGVGEDVEEGIE